VTARYKALLELPGFRRLLLSAVIGRLPSGMFSLAILLFVQARTGSFFTAGLAVGVFTFLGAGTGPWLGALVDRVGQTRVLAVTGVGQTAALVTLALVAQTGTPAIVTIALAALAGATQPPIAGCLRALWASVTDGAEELEASYALDATSQEVIWTLGPLLVGLTATLLSPAAAVLACAAITACGTALFASSGLSRAWHPAPARRRGGGAMSAGDLQALLVTVLLAGVLIGAIEVGLPALASERGARWAAGPLLALFSAGSMVGGLLYAGAPRPDSVASRYRTLLLAMVLAVAPLAIVHSLLAILLLSTVAGLGLAPMLAAQLSLIGALAPADTMTEAFAWHRTATIAGSAIGSGLGGALVDVHEANAALALGCVGVMLAWVAAKIWGRRVEKRVDGQDLASPASAFDSVELRSA
jgi:MFS family permease